MATSNHGTCLLCKENVQHRSIIKHLNQCLEKRTTSNDISEKEKIFLIKVYAGKLFWLFIEINGSSTLEELDFFLRETWLECCGHMSEFNIKGEAYSIDRGMNKKIHRIFSISDEFDYAYDFGSTTELEGKIISTRAGKLGKGIRLIARNNLPEEIKCITCQKHPEVICSICYDIFCGKCKIQHNCEGEEYMLPVVNSPRMGVCGYTGQN
jgi:hypothetical protein